MGAPKGNQFWKVRTSHGRKRKFTAATLWKGCIEYFEWCEENPLKQEKVFHTDGRVTWANVDLMRAMTIGGLCIFLDLTQETWGQYRKNKGFSEVVTRAEEVIRTQKFTGAAAGLLNPNIIARDLGLTDKQDHEHTGNVNFTTVYEKKPK